MRRMEILRGLELSKSLDNLLCVLSVCFITSPAADKMVERGRNAFRLEPEMNDVACLRDRGIAARRMRSAASSLELRHACAAAVNVRFHF